MKRRIIGIALVLAFVLSSMNVSNMAQAVGLNQNVYKLVKNKGYTQVSSGVFRKQ